MGLISLHYVAAYCIVVAVLALACCAREWWLWRQGK
jgi:hypothetical protein